MSCDFVIPPARSDGFDFDRVVVRFSPGNGPPEDLKNVRTVTACDPARGGWYDDVDATVAAPTSIHACPASCEKFKRESSGKVELIFTCTPR